MALTLSNLLQRVYRQLGQFQASTATGGSTTTVVDTKMADKQGEDDVWENGTLFIIRDAGGANAAPEGEYQRISAYDDSAGTFTVDTEFSVAPASGDRYGFANNYYPLHDLIELCNDGLENLGPIPLADTTTLDAASAQTEYDYSVDWKFRPPFSVDIQGQTGDSNNNLWTPHGRYRIIPAAPGSAATLELLPNPTASRDIRVLYLGAHPKVWDYDDVISEFIHPSLAVAACARAAVEWQIDLQGGGDEALVDLHNKLVDKVVTYEQKWQIWMPPKKQKILSWPWSQ